MKSDSRTSCQEAATARVDGPTSPGLKFTRSPLSENNHRDTKTVLSFELADSKLITHNSKLSLCLCGYFLLDAKNDSNSRCTCSGCSHCGKCPDASIGTSRPCGRELNSHSLSSNGTVLSCFPQITSTGLGCWPTRLSWSV